MSFEDSLGSPVAISWVDQEDPYGNYTFLSNLNVYDVGQDNVYLLTDN